MGISCWCVFILLVGLYWGLCYLENWKRDSDVHTGRRYAGEDLTDKEDTLFRYSH